MNVKYFLVPSLDSAKSIAEDFKHLGGSDFFLHVVSDNESGVKLAHLNTGNWFETFDLFRKGFIGLLLGLLISVLVIALISTSSPISQQDNFSHGLYLFIVLFFMGFGAWVGGLAGISIRNPKINKFSKDIKNGQYLILMYVKDYQELSVLTMMERKHPEAKLVANDRHFLNPFSTLQRLGVVREA